MIPNIASLESEVDRMTEVINQDPLLPYMMSSILMQTGENIRMQRQSANRNKQQIYLNDLLRYKNNLMHLISSRNDTSSTITYMLGIISPRPMTLEEYNNVPEEQKDTLMYNLINLKNGHLSRDDFNIWIAPFKEVKAKMIKLSDIKTEFVISNPTHDIIEILSLEEETEITEEICAIIKQLFFRNISDSKMYILANNSQIEIIDLEICSSRDVIFNGKIITLDKLITKVANLYRGIRCEEGPDILVENGIKYINTFSLRKPELITEAKIPKKQVKTSLDNGPIIGQFLSQWVNKQTRLELGYPYTIIELHKCYVEYAIQLGYNEGDLVTSQKMSRIIQPYVVDISNKNKRLDSIPNIESGQIVRSNICSVNTICYYVYTGVIPINTRSKVVSTTRLH